MSPRDLRAFLWDINHACDLLTDVVRQNSIEQYAGNEMLRLGVERAFEILAEALTNVLRLQPSLVGRITHAPRISAFRNRIAHEYWRTPHRSYGPSFTTTSRRFSARFRPFLLTYRCPTSPHKRRVQCTACTRYRRS